jgi:transposase
MLFAGCDLHKQTISVCVMNPARQIVKRTRLLCANEEAIRRFFEELGEFEAVVEATASYEWFVRLIEPFAHRVVLAHPKKLRVIAESTRKSDTLDAQVLAEFLALDMIPASYRPTPRQREHRQLVRQRDRIQRRLTSVKNRIRRMLANDNADRPRLFNAEGLAFLRQIRLSAADRFSMNQFLEEYDFGQGQLKTATSQIEAFGAASPVRERELRELLRTIPGVGFVTAEVILAELADITRFRSQNQVVAYAGLAPGQRESAGKYQELHLEKTGSKLLRTTMVEAAWRLVRHSPRGKGTYEKLKARVRAKKAIVAVARRQLTLVTAVLQTGQPYWASYVPGPAAA